MTHKSKSGSQMDSHEELYTALTLFIKHDGWNSKLTPKPVKTEFLDWSVVFS